MSNAFQKYAATTAELDFNEQRLRRILANRLLQSKQDREDSLVSGRDSTSARGLLNSSIALKDQTDRNTEFDKNDASYQQGADDELAGIARSRATASADYLAAKAEEERLAALETPLLQEVDPTDPLGWKKIAADLQAAGDPNFQPGAAPNPDPHNWAAIAEEQRNAGNPDYTGMANAALTRPPMQRVAPRTPPRSVNRPIPRNSIFRS